MAIKGKTRHQLFLPDEISVRLTRMARAQKRARSDLLVEMVDAWMNQRSASEGDDSVAKRLDRLQRSIDETRRETFIISFALFRFLRHHLIYSAALPRPDEAAQAAGQRNYQVFLDGIAQRMGRGPETVTAEGEGGPNDAN
ncbi:hypothetical protein [Sphingomonas crocodyli]|uniref:CopG family transcriptional regulator n=1 Tax=Sphingomonas crocodyli TaxID=1979270 RepID=A0A437M5Y0_9SPHN|nr:hypothetical protein [Sphingomonas crocodyli]RVT93140.1 hypothetical protein EOD43_04395 [Sphingomonas crocodyli]